MAGVAEQRDTALRPALQGCAVEEGPDEGLVDALDDPPDLSVPAFVGGERVGNLAPVGPGFALPRVLLDEGHPVQQPFPLHVVMDEVPARAHPDLRLDGDFQIGHPLRWDETAVRDAAGEVRALLAE